MISPTFLVFGSVVALFFGMMVLFQIGFRVGRSQMAQDGEILRTDIGSIKTGVFGLLGLLFAFTIGGAANRLDYRRQLIVQEANAIGTAYLRLDLVPRKNQPALRKLFRDYLDSRIHTLGLYRNNGEFEQELESGKKLQNEIWALSVEACQGTDSKAGMLLLPALNEMIDITTTRNIARLTHGPAAIIVLIFFMSLLSAVLAGYGMMNLRRGSFFFMILYSSVVVLTYYVLLDLEFPRIGFIRVDHADQVLFQLRDFIK